LIVDRSILLRSILRGMLEQWGLVVDERATAAEALAALDGRTFPGHPYWLILCSTEIDGMDWESFAGRARALPAWPGARRILLAPQSRMPNLKDMLNAGFETGIPRTIPHRKLIDALNLLCGATAPKSLSDAAALASPQAGSGGHISFDAVEFTLRCGYDPAIVADIACLFCESSSDLLARMVKAAGRYNARDVLFSAKRLRLAAEMLGAQDVLFALDTLERNIQVLHWGAVSGALTGVKAELNRVLADLPSLVAHPSEVVS
jgi:CheY-like chemotaxis protein